MSIRDVVEHYKVANPNFSFGDFDVKPKLSIIINCYHGTKLYQLTNMIKSLHDLECTNETFKDPAKLSMFLKENNSYLRRTSIEACQFNDVVELIYIIDVSNKLISTTQIRNLISCLSAVYVMRNGRKIINNVILRIVTNTKHTGLSYTRNLGLFLATGEYIKFCDDDDISCNISQLLSIIKTQEEKFKGKDLKIISCNKYIFKKNDYYNPSELDNQIKDQLENLKYNTGVVMIPSLIFKTDFIRKIKLEFPLYTKSVDIYARNSVLYFLFYEDNYNGIPMITNNQDIIFIHLPPKSKSDALQIYPKNGEIVKKLIEIADYMSDLMTTFDFEIVNYSRIINYYYIKLGQFYLIEPLLHALSASLSYDHGYSILKLTLTQNKDKIKDEHVQLLKVINEIDEYTINSINGIKYNNNDANMFSDDDKKLILCHFVMNVSFKHLYDYSVELFKQMNLTLKLASVIKLMNSLYQLTIDYKNTNFFIIDGQSYNVRHIFKHSLQIELFKIFFIKLMAISKHLKLFKSVKFEQFIIPSLVHKVDSMIKEYINMFKTISINELLFYIHIKLRNKSYEFDTLECCENYEPLSKFVTVEKIDDFEKLDLTKLKQEILTRLQRRYDSKTVKEGIDEVYEVVENFFRNNGPYSVLLRDHTYDEYIGTLKIMLSLYLSPKIENNEYIVDLEKLSNIKSNVVNEHYEYDEILTLNIKILSEKTNVVVGGLLQTPITKKEIREVNKETIKQLLGGEVGEIIQQTETQRVETETTSASSSRLISSSRLTSNSYSALSNQLTLKYLLIVLFLLIIIVVVIIVIVKIIVNRKNKKNDNRHKV